MNEREEIIYSLLYDIDETDFVFDISNTGLEVEDISRYIDTIINDINGGGVYVTKDFIIVDKKEVYWDIKINRL